MNARTLATIAAGLTAAAGIALSGWMLAPQDAARSRPGSPVQSPRRAPAVSHSALAVADPAPAPRRDDGFRITAKSEPSVSAQATESGPAGLSYAPAPGSAESAPPHIIETCVDIRGATHMTGKAQSGEVIGRGISAIDGVFGNGRFRPAELLRPPAVPLVFHEVPPDTVPLTPPQSAAVESLQEQFITEIGGETADPGSPEYLEKWRRLQPVADYRLRAMIGAQAFAAWQADAYLKSKQEQAGK